MIQEFWNGILELTAKLVIPDWAALIALIPLALLVVVALWLLRTVYRFATAGPTRRGMTRVPPAPPPGIHLPGPTWAPVLAAGGAFLFFWGLVLGGAPLLLGLVALALSLLVWGREGLREYDQLVQAERPVPLVHGEPPPGVHMPGPSFRPIVGSLALAVLFFGLVFPGWLLLVGLVFTIVTLLGWLIDARAEYVKAEEADRTGHLDPLAPPAWPRRVLAVFSVLVVAAIVVDAGILPPRPTTADGGAPAAPGAPAEPGASGSPGGSGAPGSSGAPGGSGPPTNGDVTITAEGIAFTTPEVQGPADKAFTIAFDNRDQGIPHDIDITDAGGAVVFDGEVVAGPVVQPYQVPALAAGGYPFHCSLHPSMTGTLTVQ